MIGNKETGTHTPDIRYGDIIHTLIDGEDTFSMVVTVYAGSFRNNLEAFQAECSTFEGMPIEWQYRGPQTPNNDGSTSFTIKGIKSSYTGHR